MLTGVCSNTEMKLQHRLAYQKCTGGGAYIGKNIVDFLDVYGTNQFFSFFYILYIYIDSWLWLMPYKIIG